MYNGRMVERGPVEQLIKEGHHPYTCALLAVVTDFDRFWANREEVIADRDRSERVTKGCGFAPRCPRVRPECRETDPVEREVAPGHMVSCHYPIGAGD